MPPIISVENLGKCYRLHHESRERYTALRDVISRKAGGFLEKLKLGKAEKLKPLSASQNFSLSASSEEDFWALKDVSFEVRQGEVVGIIGRNGAGKSTLLKVLSRITEPTKGRITLKGRVASLLEVGTGFHPELTGRENIFLNGAILGMTKVEIKSKFDEIVAFAEIEKFLDTPVKRYSSGMYVRLAFAVAAHLEPEILIVDEVLAVGDAEFQKKCLGKMQEASRGGRTVLFVSHNMAAVESLCSRAILLRQGQIADDGPADMVTSRYYASNDSNSYRADFNGCARILGPAGPCIDSIEILGQDAERASHIRMGQSFSIRFTAQFPCGLRTPSVGLLIIASNGVQVTDFRSEHQLGVIVEPSGRLAFEIAVECCPYYPRSYSVEPYIYNTSTHETYDWIKSALSFEVLPNPELYGGRPMDSRHGFCHPSSCWRMSEPIKV